MLLKENHYSNHLIKQKRFMLLGPSMLRQHLSLPNFKEIKSQENYRHRLDKRYSIYSNKSQKLKNNSLETLNNVVNINKYPFLENFQCFRYKQIHTYFRNIISDQKKRAIFSKAELRKAVFKALLSTDQKSFLFTRRMLLLGSRIPVFESFPLIFKKVDLIKDVSQLSFRRKNTFSLLEAKNIFKQKAFGINKSYIYRYPIFGPILFLEKTINARFTDKIKSFCRIRNRCLLSGRSSVVGKYRLSRICFRYYASCGMIPGLTKNRK